MHSYTELHSNPSPYIEQSRISKMIFDMSDINIDGAENITQLESRETRVATLEHASQWGNSTNWYICEFFIISKF